MLAVVEDEKSSLAAELLGHNLGEAITGVTACVEGVRDGCRNAVAVGERRQLANKHAAWIFRAQPPGGLVSQAGLAAARRAHDRQESSLLQELAHKLDLRNTPHERSCGTPNHH